MKVFRLDQMTKGWFAGDFKPTAFKTKDFEVAVKHYKKGDREGRHVHKVATEITLIAEGKVNMNGTEYRSGDIIVLDPGEATDFEALDSTMTVVVKSPSAAGDKYDA